MHSSYHIHKPASTHSFPHKHMQYNRYHMYIGHVNSSFILSLETWKIMPVVSIKFAK